MSFTIQPDAVDITSTTNDVATPFVVSEAAVTTLATLATLQTFKPEQPKTISNNPHNPKTNNRH